MSHTNLCNEKPNRSLSEFEFLQDPKDKSSRLGVGSFATVKLAKEKKNNKLVALKMVDLEESKSKAADLHNLRTEIHIHKRIDHPNIIKYHGYTQENYRIFIALDYAEKGNLYAFIHRKKTPLSSEEIIRFFYQTCSAIQYLHQNDIMHRDIKPENLLLDKDLNIKLCDFGWAAERVKEKRTTFCGTFEYMAPEVVHKRPYDYRIDIWSLGVLLYELIHKEAPYKGRSLSEIWESLSKGTVTYSATIDPQARDLIQRILRLNPSDRPSISQILSHPWVKSQLAAYPAIVHNPVPVVHAEPKYEKVEHIPNKEKENHAYAHEAVERPMTSGAQSTVKSRKQSGWQSINPQPAELARKRPVEEQNLESSGRAHTKSSGSLVRNVMESLDTEERNPVNYDSIRKKNPSPSMKRSLQSIVSPSTRMTPPDQVYSGGQTSIGAIPSISNILENLSISSTKAVSLSQHPKLNKSMTPASILTRANTSNTLASSASTSNCQTPVMPDNLRVFTTSNRPKGLVTPGTSSRQLFTPTAASSINTSSVRGPNHHQKTLTIINESNQANPAQRNFTESYGHIPATTTSAGHRVVYKGNRFVISPRVVDQLTYEPSKEVSRGLESLVSPVGMARSKMMMMIRPNMEVSAPKLDESALPKMNEGLKSAKNFENLMTMRPQMGNEEKMKTEGNMASELAFNRFVKGTQYRPKVMSKGGEEGMSRRYNKENRIEVEKKMKISRGGERIYASRIYSNE